jgi:hypothetical protein
MIEEIRITLGNVIWRCRKFPFVRVVGGWMTSGKNSFGQVLLEVEKIKIWKR